MDPSAEGRWEAFGNLYQEFNRRNFSAVIEKLAPDVSWANGLEGGEVNGREAVRDYWLKQLQTISPHVEPVSFEQIGDETVVRVHQTVKDLAGHLTLEQDVFHVYKVQNGLIVSMRIRPVGS